MRHNPQASRTVGLSLVALVLLAATAAAVAGEATAFDRMARHYEAVRTELAADSLDGVSDEARRIAAIASGLADGFDDEVAGVAAPDREAVRELLPAVAAAAERLAVADDLESARGAFGALTKPLVRYRALVSGDKPEIIYCSMKKRAWLQPVGEEIGNPYYGSSMLGCGEIVSR